MGSCQKQPYVLQIWEGGKYVTKTAPNDYWTTCKSADKFEKRDSLYGWCRVREVGNEQDDG